jgi:hypothetical protein
MSKFGYPDACDFERVQPIAPARVLPSRALCQHLARPYADVDRCSIPPSGSRRMESPISQGAGGGGGGGGTVQSLDAQFTACLPNNAVGTDTWNVGVGNTRIAGIIGQSTVAATVDRIEVDLRDTSGGAIGGTVVASIATTQDPNAGSIIASSPPVNIAGVNGLVSFPIVAPLAAFTPYHFQLDGSAIAGGNLEVGGTGPGAGQCTYWLFATFLGFWSPTPTGNGLHFELWGTL